MNPLASTKCAGRLLMALAAFTSILLIAGCSSSSKTPTNPEGFTNASLTGTYVFSSQGLDSSGYPVAIAGTATANGTGGITGGTIDIVNSDPEFNELSPVAQAITAGSYSITSDGRGLASLTSAYGTYGFDFVLYSTSSGLITEYDANGTGSGTLDLQTAVTSLSALAGPYAFSLAGSDGSNLAPFAMVGAFSLDQNGGVTGAEDFNDNLIVENEPLTGGAATLGTGTGPGTIPLASNSFPIIFDYYAVDATHFKLIETDYAEFLAGDAYTQTGFTSIPTTAMAFTVAGGVSAPVAAAGFVTISGASASGTGDINANGTVVTGTSFTGTAGAAGPGGRVAVALSDFNPATNLVLYPSSGGTLMLETDTANLTIGSAQVQTAGAAIAASEGYGLNLSAINTSEGEGEVFEEDDIAQFTTTSSGFSGVVDINDEGTTTPNQALAGTYPTATSVTTTIGSNAFVSFNFYPVTNNQFLLLETDSNQIGVGQFWLQSSSSSAVAGHRALSTVRPRARAGAVKRSK